MQLLCAQPTAAQHARIEAATVVSGLAKFAEMYGNRKTSYSTSTSCCQPLGLDRILGLKLQSFAKLCHMHIAAHPCNAYKDGMVITIPLVLSVLWPVVQCAHAATAMKHTRIVCVALSF